MTVNSKMQRKGVCNQEKTGTSRLLNVSGNALPTRLAVTGVSIGNETEILYPSPFTTFNPGLAMPCKHRIPHCYFFFQKTCCSVHSTAQLTYITLLEGYTFFSFFFLRLSSLFFLLPELFLKIKLHNISFDVFPHFLKEKISIKNNQEERDGVALQGYLCQIPYVINLHAWNSQMKRLKFSLEAHAKRKWNHSVSLRKH